MNSLVCALYQDRASGHEAITAMQKINMETFPALNHIRPRPVGVSTYAENHVYCSYLDTNSTHEASLELKLQILPIEELLLSLANGQFQWDHHTVKATACIIHFIFQETALNGVCYVGRKELPLSLPLRSKIIVDKVRSLVLFLPQKQGSAITGAYKVGRRMFAVDTRRNLTGTMWTLTTNRDAEMPTDLDFSPHGAENELLKRVRETCYPKRLLVYHSVKNTRATLFESRLALYEEYDGDLFQLLKTKKIDTSNRLLLVRLMHAMASGMLQLHEQFLSHGDIKEENILIRIGKDPNGSDWEVVFCDFDFLRDEKKRHTVDDAIHGTYKNFSPEILQLLEDGIDNVRYYNLNPARDSFMPCDVFALGAVFYRLWHGRESWYAKKAGCVLADYTKWMPKDTEMRCGPSPEKYAEYMILQMLFPKYTQRLTAKDAVRYFGNCMNIMERKK